MGMITVSFAITSARLIHVSLSTQTTPAASSERWRGIPEETVRISDADVSRVAAFKGGSHNEADGNRSHATRGQAQTLFHALQIATTDGTGEEGRAFGGWREAILLYVVLGIRNHTVVCYITRRDRRRRRRLLMAFCSSTRRVTIYLLLLFVFLTHRTHRGSWCANPSKPTTPRTSFRDAPSI